MCILGSMRAAAQGGVGNSPTVPWIKVIIHRVTAHSVNSNQPSKRLFQTQTEITALTYHERASTVRGGGILAADREVFLPIFSWLSFSQMC